MRECVYVFFTECKATITMNKTHFYRSCFAFGQDHRLRRRRHNYPLRFSFHLAVFTGAAVLSKIDGLYKFDVALSKVTRIVAPKTPIYTHQNVYLRCEYPPPPLPLFTLLSFSLSILSHSLFILLLCTSNSNSFNSLKASCPPSPGSATRNVSKGATTGGKSKLV